MKKEDVLKTDEDNKNEDKLKNKETRKQEVTMASCHMAKLSPGLNYFP